MVAVDTSAAGEHEGTVTVDSDGGSAAIRVSMMVGHAPLPAFKAAATTNPEPVLETPQGAASDPQRDLAMAASAAADCGLGCGCVSRARRTLAQPGRAQARWTEPG